MFSRLGADNFVVILEYRQNSMIDNPRGVMLRFSCRQRNRNGYMSDLGDKKLVSSVGSCCIVDPNTLAVCVSIDVREA